jgi:hypothetical protein
VRTLVTNVRMQNETLVMLSGRQDFRNERESQSSNQSNHHLFITTEAQRRCAAAEVEEGEEAAELNSKEKSSWVLIQGGLMVREGMNRRGGRGGGPAQPGTSPGPADWALENHPSSVSLH